MKDRTRPIVPIIALLVGLHVVSQGAPPAAFAQTVASFDPPEITTWTPQGCRYVPFDDAVLPSRESWRMIHADTHGSDEISRAIAPVLSQDWTAESATYNTTGPVLDSDGNVYISPLVPYENVVLISLDPTTGARNWAIAGTGAPSGSSTPIVLDDPDNPGEQLVYLGLYDRALAVKPDGTIVWDVTTGLTLGIDMFDNGLIGLNYHSGIDALVGLTVDGFVYVLDRATGAQLLASPYQLPGEVSPDIVSALPPAVLAAAEDAWQVLVNAPDGSFDQFVNLLLGQNVKVANMFSVDPNTGRLWIAGTAPDAEDGTVDGISEFGALYRLELSPAGGGLYSMSESCHASFDGGTASTPALPGDGSRVYVGDTFGKLIAVSATDCSTMWDVDLGQQIVGSVAVSSDNKVVYASSRDFVTQVFDQDTAGSIGWVSTMSGLFDDLEAGQVEFNLNLTAIGANALAFQAGAGIILAGVPLAVATGVGILDRETGAVSYFTSSPEETVAVMTSAADGAFYIGNSPVRRAFSIGLGLATDPLVGGVTKFAVERHDLLMRDAACAAQDRAANASANVGVCLDSAQADGTQLLELITQVREDGAPGALGKGEVSAANWARIDATLTAAEAGLDDFLVGGDDAGLVAAAADLAETCSLLAGCAELPRLDCRGALKAGASIQQKGGIKDKMKLKWSKGDATTQLDLADPTTSADYSVCWYAGASPSRVGASTVLADAALWSVSGTKGYKFKDTDKTYPSDGVAGVVLKGGEQGKSTIVVKGKGANLPDPVLPLDGPVVVQVVNRGTDVCFSATFDGAGIVKNDASQFKAKSP